MLRQLTFVVCLTVLASVQGVRRMGDCPKDIPASGDGSAEFLMGRWHDIAKSVDSRLPPVVCQSFEFYPGRDGNRSVGLFVLREYVSKMCAD